MHHSLSNATSPLACHPRLPFSFKWHQLVSTCHFTPHTESVFQLSEQILRWDEGLSAQTDDRGMKWRWDKAKESLRGARSVKRDNTKNKINMKVRGGEVLLDMNKVQDCSERFFVGCLTQQQRSRQEGRILSFLCHVLPCPKDELCYCEAWKRLLHFKFSRLKERLGKVLASWSHQGFPNEAHLELKINPQYAHKQTLLEEECFCLSNQVENLANQPLSDLIWELKAIICFEESAGSGEQH